METLWKVLSSLMVLFFFGLCNGLPINLENSGPDPHTQLLTGLVAVLLTVCSVVLLAGCLCCQRKNGFEDEKKQEFRDSPVASSATIINNNLDHGHVNPIANSSSEFTIFTPISPPHHNNNVFLANQRIVSCRQEDYKDSDIDASSWFDGSEKDFPRTKLKYIRELGKGWFGRVVEGTAQNINDDPENSEWTPVVVRILEASATSKQKLLFLNDVAIYKCGYHPNILRILGRSLDNVPLLLLQEYCPQGDLKKYLRTCRMSQDNLLAEDMSLRWCYQLTLALKFLHDQKLTHPDLAARNCQLSENLWLKLGDYGLSASYYPEDYYQGSPGVPLRWCAPEIISYTSTTIQTTPTTAESNIWALGITMWEILEWGEQPYGELTDDEVISQVLGTPKVRLPIPTYHLIYTDYMYKIMQSCWYNHESRMTVSQIELMMTDLVHVYENTKITTEMNSDISNGGEPISLQDFDSRWNAFKPNSPLAEGNDVLEDLQPNVKSQKQDRTQKSASLNNLHGSLDNLLDTRQFDPMESWLENVASDTSDLSFVRGLSEAITDLDNAIAMENFNSSPEFEKCKLTLGGQITSSESETEDENWRKKIERGAYTEKVRQKSRSVADLMVLTHIDCSESDSETLPSLDFKVNQRVRYLKNTDNQKKFGSEGNLLHVQDNTFQEELKKLQEERRDSLLFVPDKFSERSFSEEGAVVTTSTVTPSSFSNNRLDNLENSPVKKLMEKLNSPSEIVPSQRVYNVFNVCVQHVNVGGTICDKVGETVSQINIDGNLNDINKETAYSTICDRQLETKALKHNTIIGQDNSENQNNISSVDSVNQNLEQHQGANHIKNIFNSLANRKISNSVSLPSGPLYEYVNEVYNECIPSSPLEKNEILNQTLVIQENDSNTPIKKSPETYLQKFFVNDIDRNTSQSNSTNEKNQIYRESIFDDQKLCQIENVDQLINYNTSFNTFKSNNGNIDEKRFLSSESLPKNDSSKGNNFEVKIEILNEQNSTFKTKKNKEIITPKHLINEISLKENIVTSKENNKNVKLKVPKLSEIIQRNAIDYKVHRHHNECNDKTSVIAKNEENEKLIHQEIVDKDSGLNTPENSASLEKLYDDNEEILDVGSFDSDRSNEVNTKDEDHHDKNKKEELSAIPYVEKGQTEFENEEEITNLINYCINKETRLICDLFLTHERSNYLKDFPCIRIDEAPLINREKKNDDRDTLSAETNNKGSGQISTIDLAKRYQYFNCDYKTDMQTFLLSETYHSSSLIRSPILSSDFNKDIEELGLSNNNTDANHFCNIDNNNLITNHEIISSSTNNPKDNITTSFEFDTLSCKEISEKNKISCNDALNIKFNQPLQNHLNLESNKDNRSFMSDFFIEKSKENGKFDDKYLEQGSSAIYDVATLTERMLENDKKEIEDRNSIILEKTEFEKQFDILKNESTKYFDSNSAMKSVESQNIAAPAIVNLAKIDNGEINFDHNRISENSEPNLDSNLEKKILLIENDVSEKVDKKNNEKGSLINDSEVCTNSNDVLDTSKIVEAINLTVLDNELKSEACRINVSNTNFNVEENQNSMKSKAIVKERINSKDDILADSFEEVCDVNNICQTKNKTAINNNKNEVGIDQNDNNLTENIHKVFKKNENFEKLFSNNAVLDSTKSFLINEIECYSSNQQTTDDKTKLKEKNISYDVNTSMHDFEDLNMVLSNECNNMENENFNKIVTTVSEIQKDNCDQEKFEVNRKKYGNNVKVNDIQNSSIKSEQSNLEKCTDFRQIYDVNKCYSSSNDQIIEIPNHTTFTSNLNIEDNCTDKTKSNHNEVFHNLEEGAKNIDEDQNSNSNEDFEQFKSFINKLEKFKEFEDFDKLEGSIEGEIIEDFDGNINFTNLKEIKKCDNSCEKPEKDAENEINKYLSAEILLDEYCVQNTNSNKLLEFQGNEYLYNKLEKDAETELSKNFGQNSGSDKLKYENIYKLKKSTESEQGKYFDENTNSNKLKEISKYENISYMLDTKSKIEDYNKKSLYDDPERDTESQIDKYFNENNSSNRLEEYKNENGSDINTTLLFQNTNLNKYEDSSDMLKVHVKDKIEEFKFFCNEMDATSEIDKHFNRSKNSNKLEDTHDKLKSKSDENVADNNVNQNDNFNEAEEHREDLCDKLKRDDKFRKLEDDLKSGKSGRIYNQCPIEISCEIQKNAPLLLEEPSNKSSVVSCQIDEINQTSKFLENEIKNYMHTMSVYNKTNVKSSIRNDTLTASSTDSLGETEELGREISDTEKHENIKTNNDVQKNKNEVEEFFKSEDFTNVSLRKEAEKIAMLLINEIENYVNKAIEINNEVQNVEYTKEKRYSSIDSTYHIHKSTYDKNHIDTDLRSKIAQTSIFLNNEIENYTNSKQKVNFATSDEISSLTQFLNYTNPENRFNQELCNTDKLLNSTKALGERESNSKIDLNNFEFVEEKMCKENNTSLYGNKNEIRDIYFGQSTIATRKETKIICLDDAHSYKNNKIDQTFVFLRNEVENYIPTVSERKVDFDLSNTQDRISMNSLTHLSSFTSTPFVNRRSTDSTVILGASDDYSIDYYSGLKTSVDPGDTSDLQCSSNFVRPNHSNDLYSLETWDNFLGKSFDEQESATVDFNDFSQEPHSLLFLEGDNCNGEHMNQLKMTKILDETYNASKYTVPVGNDTFVKEKKQGDVNATCEVTAEKSLGQIDKEQLNIGTTYEASGGGWFLHPQCNSKESPAEITQNQENSGARGSDDSYVGFNMDDEIMAAIRNELLTKLPHAQRASSDHQIEENCEEMDSTERNEVFLRYNVYNTPLSPIPEESCDSEFGSGRVSPKRVNDTSDDEGNSSDWSVQEDNNSSNAHTEEINSPKNPESPARYRTDPCRHTPSQDSCCSNDTLFNIEELNGGVNDRIMLEPVLNLPDQLDNPLDSMEDETSGSKYDDCNAEAHITESEKTLQNNTIDQHELKSSLVPLIKTEHSYIVDFLDNERYCEVNASIDGGEEISSASDVYLTVSDNTFSFGQNIAPLNSPEDRPWKELQASFRNCDDDQMPEITSYDEENSENFLINKDSEDYPINKDSEEVEAIIDISASKYFPHKDFTNIVNDQQNKPGQIVEIDQDSFIRQSDGGDVDDSFISDEDIDKVLREEMESEILMNQTVEQSTSDILEADKENCNSSDDRIYVNLTKTESGESFDTENSSSCESTNNLDDKKELIVGYENLKNNICDNDDEIYSKVEETEDSDDKFSRFEDLFGPLTDIRFSGPGTSTQLMTTSFSESNELGDDQDWDSGSDTRSSSSGEFIWKEGEHEASVKALRAPPQLENVDYANPMENIQEEMVSVDSSRDNSSSGSGSEGEDECPEFVPSAWDKYATPTKSALRSPEKTLERNKEEKLQNQQLQKEKKSKGVWFKKQKYHCIYEYPREPESPVLQSYDLWKPTPDYDTLSDWDLDTDIYLPSSLSDSKTYENQPKQDHLSKNLYHLTTFTDVNIDPTVLDEDFFVSSSSRPFDMLGGLTSQFFPGKQFPSNTWADNANVTPDSGVEDVATQANFADDATNSYNNQTETDVQLTGVQSLKVLAATAVEKGGNRRELGGLRHTRNKLKLDLPPSPSAFTSNRTFSVEPVTDEIGSRQVPTFTTFGKSRFLVQHVDTPPDSERADKNVSFEALPHRKPEQSQTYFLETEDWKRQKKEKQKIESVRGEASLLDSTDEDSGIESCTLDRKKFN